MNGFKEYPVEGIVHDDFANAPQHQKFRGELAKLFGVLVLQVAITDPGKWCSRVLRSGAWVSMKREEDGRRVIRIARSDAFKTDNGPRLWLAELRTFEIKFDMMHWERVHEERERGIATLYYECDKPAVKPPAPEPDLFAEIER